MNDYFQLLLSSIDVVEGLALGEKGDNLKFNASQCQYLALELLETRRFLTKTERRLRTVYHKKRKTFRELYSVVKGAESLVHQCCCRNSSWLEAALTLHEIKSDIMDIILHLKWWTSILDVIARGSSSEDEEFKLLGTAEKMFKDLLQSLYADDHELEKAAQTDRKRLLVEVGEKRANSEDPLQDETILLAFLQSELTGEQVHSKELLSKLNQYKVNYGLSGDNNSGIIGQGSSGTVLDVLWFGRRCALKLHNNLDADEARRLKEHQHPHVVRYYRYWEAPCGQDQSPKSHMLMEYLPTDLRNHIKWKLEKSPSLGMPFTLPVAIDIMLQIAKAMWHLYHKKLVHRDLKTGNVLLRPVSEESVHELFEEGYVHVKLGDFGSAKGYTMSSTSAPISNRFGTTQYSAPEVLAWKDGEQGRAFPPKADIWSFGVTCSEILSGQVPFINEPKGTLLMTLKNGVRPPLPDGTPEYLKFCITSCWEKNPEDRPTFLDLWRMLRHAKLLSLMAVQPESSYDQFSYISRRGKLKQMPRPQLVIDGRTLHPGDWRRFFQGIVRKVVRILGLGTATFPRVTSPQSDRNLVMREMANMRDNNSVSGAESPKALKTIRSQRPNLCHIVNQVWPPENCPCPKDSNLDIIFFEGNVMRDFADTWIQRGKRDVCWPRDWLPQDLGSSIRVFLLNYRIADGFGRVVENLQKHLVCSDLSGQGGWRRPIVLVGHSLGGIVLKQLVVELDRKVQSLPSLTDRREIDRAKISKSFLKCLRGCFSYSVPHGGLVTTDLRLVTNVFGEFISEESLRIKFFQDLSIGSKLLEDLSTEFTEADRYGSDADNVGQIKLSALLEGKNFTGERLIPEKSMQTFTGEFITLSDSDHREITQPIRQDHPIYKELLEFLLLIKKSQIAGVAPTADVQ